MKNLNKFVYVGPWVALPKAEWESVRSSIHLDILRNMAVDRVEWLCHVTRVAVYSAQWTGVRDQGYSITPWSTPVPSQLAVRLAFQLL